jgi:DNA processing protein
VFDPIAQLRLIRTDGVGPQTYRRLIARFRTAAAALDALPGIARNAGRAAAPVIPSAAQARAELDRHAELGATPIFLGDTLYPPLLAELPDAPPMIAVRGDAALLTRPTVAIVGARNASVNGQRIAETLAEDLARAGYGVVSGLARGIDGAAHRGALRAGVTFAAIPGGLDKIYPPEHADLQARITEAGAVIAESPPGTAPMARHFPKRNRIIAGLALGVVVIEAAHRSGSLITARMALDYHRELFAVPGSPLDARCQGSNDLLRQGAHFTENLADILNNLPHYRVRPGLAAPAPSPISAPDVPETDPQAARSQLTELLSASPMPVDEIARRCHLSPAALSAALMELELIGRIEALPGNRVGLIAPV